MTGDHQTRSPLITASIALQNLSGAKLGCRNTIINDINCDRSKFAFVSSIYSFLLSFFLVVFLRFSLFVFFFFCVFSQCGNGGNSLSLSLLRTNCSLSLSLPSSTFCVRFLVSSSAVWLLRHEPPAGLVASCLSHVRVELHLRRPPQQHLIMILNAVEYARGGTALRRLDDLDPWRPAFVEHGQIVRIGGLAYHIVNLLGHSATLIVVRIASLQFHAYFLPYRYAVCIAFLFMLIGCTCKRRSRKGLIYM